MTEFAYAMLWMTDTESVHTLVYRNEGGEEYRVRTYLEGHLDSRLGDESAFQRFSPPDDTSIDVLKWMLDNRDGDMPPNFACLVEVSLARSIRSDSVFADPPIGAQIQPGWTED